MCSSSESDRPIEERGLLALVPAGALAVCGLLVSCSPTEPPSMTGSPPPSSVVYGDLVFRMTASYPEEFDVYVQLGVENISESDTISGEYAGGCMIDHIVVYREGEWNEPAWDAWGIPSNRACTADAAGFTLAPGDSARLHAWEHHLFVGDILGDSLPAGRYRLGAKDIPIEPLDSMPDDPEERAGWERERVELVAAESIRMP